jgi:hypothetical protein
MRPGPPAHTATQLPIQTLPYSLPDAAPHTAYKLCHPLSSAAAPPHPPPRRRTSSLTHPPTHPPLPPHAAAARHLDLELLQALGGVVVQHQAAKDGAVGARALDRLKVGAHHGVGAVVVEGVGAPGAGGAPAGREGFLRNTGDGKLLHIPTGSLSCRACPARTLQAGVAGAAGVAA